jgi:flagellar motor switch/type III secretory pathway protein FliN
VTDAIPGAPRAHERPAPRDGSAGDARVSWLATRLLERLPDRLEATLGVFGAVELVLEGPAAREGAAPDHVAFGLGRERVVGRVALDVALAHRIVALALEVAPYDDFSAVGPLGLGARGLVAGFVASALHAFRAPLAVALVAPSAEALRAEGAVSLALRVRVAGGAGWARLDVPPDWLADAARVSTDPAALGALTFEAVIELARTTLRAEELAGLALGDAVVFDGVSAVVSGAPWPARLVVEAYAAEASVSAEARVTVTREFDGTPVVETTALPVALAPLEVVAELARVTLRGHEVLGLGPGASLELAGTRGSRVALRVGGEVRAEGVLVDIDGALGVRVTSPIRGPEIASDGR